MKQHNRIVRQSDSASTQPAHRIQFALQRNRVHELRMEMPLADFEMYKYVRVRRGAYCIPHIRIWIWMINLLHWSDSVSPVVSCTFQNGCKRRSCTIHIHFCFNWIQIEKWTLWWYARPRSACTHVTQETMLEIEDNVQRTVLEVIYACVTRIRSIMLPSMNMSFSLAHTTPYLYDVVRSRLYSLSPCSADLFKMCQRQEMCLNISSLVVCHRFNIMYYCHVNRRRMVLCTFVTNSLPLSLFPGHIVFVCV